MVFLELSMRLNVNEFSCLYKTFNRCTEINMHYLLIDIKLILKYMYHKHWLLTRRHIIKVLCMTYFEMVKYVLIYQNTLQTYQYLAT